jgi:hypothetical protein
MAIPWALRTSMSQTRALFDLPDGAKMALDKAQTPANRGSERFGGQTPRPVVLPERKQGY